MGGFTFQVACLRLVANKPLFGVHSIPVGWPVLRQNLNMAEIMRIYFSSHEIFQNDQPLNILKYPSRMH